MPFVCDPEYTSAIKRLCKAVSGLNFTESTDPDMLAVIYEKNMCTTDKKCSGTFYTPSEIVMFMCRESLANYLSNCTGLSLDMMLVFVNEGFSDTAGEYTLPEDLLTNIDRLNNALANVRIFDPSVGCGAFAVCIAEEIVRLRKNIVPNLTQKGLLSGKIETSYTAQLLFDAVRNSIFATDIDPISVEITRLRLWHRLASACGWEMTAEDGENQMPCYSSFECNVKCADSLLGYEVCGFDIVIGNPPYISAVESAKNGKKTRHALRAKFPQLTGAFDIYTAFLLDGVRKTNENGVFCWIIPNKFLVSRYAAPVLEHLKQNGLRQSISVSDMGVFERVRVYPIIIIGNKYDVRNGRAFEPDSDTTQYSATALNTLSERKFIQKPEPRAYKTFADYDIKIAAGAAGFQARALSKYICADPRLTEAAGLCAYNNTNRVNDPDSVIPFVVSGCIDRYSIKYDKVRYMGTTYERAYIAKGKEIADSKWELWCREKICIAGLTRELEAYYSRRPLALGVGAYAIYDFGGFDPLFLLGVLNSRFMSWYINEKFHERHLSGKYLAINRFTLEQLPLVHADKQTQSLISRDANRLLAVPHECPETVQLTRKIDEMVYQLYSVDKDQIDAIERHKCAE